MCFGLIATSTTFSYIELSSRSPSLAPDGPLRAAKSLSITRSRAYIASTTRCSAPSNSESLAFSHTDPPCIPIGTTRIWTPHRPGVLRSQHKSIALHKSLARRKSFSSPPKRFWLSSAVFFPPRRSPRVFILHCRRSTLSRGSQHHEHEERSGQITLMTTKLLGDVLSLSHSLTLLLSCSPTLLISYSITLTLSLNIFLTFSLSQDHDHEECSGQITLMTTKLLVDVYGLAVSAHPAHDGVSSCVDDAIRASSLRSRHRPFDCSTP